MTGSAGRQMHAFESTQGTFGCSGNRGETQIELNHFVSGSLALIRHIHIYRESITGAQDGFR